MSSSARTYEIIKLAIERHDWTAFYGNPDVYLQGSYRNDTNIYGDSDVDVVAECSGIFYDNVPRTGGGSGYSWNDYRAEMLRVLQAAFPGQVTSKNKCIKVEGNSGWMRR